MAKPKIIDIDFEFDDLDFDETKINRLTGLKNYYTNISDKEREDRNTNISKAKKNIESIHKGKTRPWSGQKRKIKSIEQHTKETKAKISAKKKGQIPWNKGLPMDDTSKDKVRLTKNSKACKTPYGVFQFFSYFLDYCIRENIFVDKKINVRYFLRRQFAKQVEGYEYISQEEYQKIIRK